MFSYLRITLTLAGLLLAGCGQITTHTDSGPAYSMNLSATPDAIPRYEPKSKYGNPATYKVRGRTYKVMQSSTGYRARGTASWYGRKFHGRLTSSREVYNMYSMTAAHKTLPLPTYVRVTNLDNGRSTIVKVNDRGPFHDNRLIDLSYAAASKLGIVETGTGRVEIVALDPRRPGPPPKPTQSSTKPKVAAAKLPAPKPAVNKSASSQDAGKDKQLYIQMGAFISRTNAERMSKELTEEKIPPVQIHTTNGAEKPVYRVRIGPIASVEEADRLAKTFISRGVGNPQIVTD